MKRVLIALLLLAGFVLAGCEEEEHERPYGYREPEYREYRDGRRREEYERREYRLVDETPPDSEVLWVETTVQP